MAKPRRKLLISLMKDLDVTGHTDLIRFLNALYDAMKKDLGQYTYLAYTSDMGLTASCNLGLVIQGKLKLSDKNCARIARALALTGNQHRYFTALLRYTNALTPEDRNEWFGKMKMYKENVLTHQLDLSLARYYENWYTPMIREMTGLAGFDGNPKWIRERLSFPLTIKQIQCSLTVLEELDVIKRGSDGKFTKSAARVSTEAEVDALSIVQFHLNAIEMGKEAITRLPGDARDIRAATVSLPNAAIPEVKKLIGSFLSALVDLEAKFGAHEEVFQMNMQFFPVTQNKSRGHE